ncbi:MAG: hypothetical protein H0U87_04545 [Acidobacteria bacterium]|nr:hypothetical protein [Acidobacteriota bacterium]
MSRKIEGLLEKAALITNSSDDEMSSVASAKRNYSNAFEAENFFVKFKEKLFQIRKWNALSGLSSYELFDANGNVCKRETTIVGDFIRITLHGSGMSDWVRVVNIDEDSDEIILTVQPTYNPTEETLDAGFTSHFFTAESTNNFCLQKTGETINFYVVGLHEKSNTEDTKNIIETVRNVATANLGHYLGIQKGEWTTFCENFLEIKGEE